jgi:hypothetical protein
MSVAKKIIQEIEGLSKEEKQKVLRELQAKYFEIPSDSFVVGGNYKFWLNEKDEDYDSEV